MPTFRREDWICGGSEEEDSLNWWEVEGGKGEVEVK